MQLGGGLEEIAANIALLVYICDKSCIGERDKNCTKNRMCKRAFKARLLRRFCRATQCNFCRAEAATSIPHV